MPNRKQKRCRALDKGAYLCPACGERIIVAMDPSDGMEQRYVEDCPICCKSSVIHLEFFCDGTPTRVWAQAE